MELVSQKTSVRKRVESCLEDVLLGREITNLDDFMTYFKLFHVFVFQVRSLLRFHGFHVRR